MVVLGFLLLSFALFSQSGQSIYDVRFGEFYDTFEGRSFSVSYIFDARTTQLRTYSVSMVFGGNFTDQQRRRLDDYLRRKSEFWSNHLRENGRNLLQSHLSSITEINQNAEICQDSSRVYPAQRSIFNALYRAIFDNQIIFSYQCNSQDNISLEIRLSRRDSGYCFNFTASRVTAQRVSTNSTNNNTNRDITVTCNFGIGPYGEFGLEYRIPRNPPPNNNTPRSGFDFKNPPAPIPMTGNPNSFEPYPENRIDIYAISHLMRKIGVGMSPQLFEEALEYLKRGKAYEFIDKIVDEASSSNENFRRVLAKAEEFRKKLQLPLFREARDRPVTVTVEVPRDGEDYRTFLRETAHSLNAFLTYIFSYGSPLIPGAWYWMQNWFAWNPYRTGFFDSNGLTGPAADRYKSLTTEYTDTLINHLTGHFDQLISKMIGSVWSLIFLDNRVNFREAPNLNFPRELFELGTFGTHRRENGSRIANYTDRDVELVARAVTGYREVCHKPSNLSNRVRMCSLSRAVPSYTSFVRSCFEASLIGPQSTDNVFVFSLNDWKFNENEFVNRYLFEGTPWAIPVRGLIANSYDNRYGYFYDGPSISSLGPSHCFNQDIRRLIRNPRPEEMDNLTYHLVYNVGSSGNTPSATAKRLATQILGFFGRPDLSDHVIDQFARIIMNSGFNLNQIYKILFKSQFIFSEETRNKLYKTPLEVIFSIVRALNYPQVYFDSTQTGHFDLLTAEFQRIRTGVILRFDPNRRLNIPSFFLRAGDPLILTPDGVIGKFLQDLSFQHYGNPSVFGRGDSAGQERNGSIGTNRAFWNFRNLLLARNFVFSLQNSTYHWFKIYLDRINIPLLSSSLEYSRFELDGQDRLLHDFLRMPLMRYGWHPDTQEQTLNEYRKHMEPYIKINNDQPFGGPVDFADHLVFSRLGSNPSPIEVVRYYAMLFGLRLTSEQEQILVDYLKEVPIRTSSTPSGEIPLTSGRISEDVVSTVPCGWLGEIQNRCSRVRLDGTPNPSGQLTRKELLEAWVQHKIPGLVAAMIMGIPEFILK